MLLGEPGCVSALESSSKSAQVFAGLVAVTPGAVTDLSGLILNSANSTLNGHACLFADSATSISGTVSCPSGAQTWDVALSPGWNTLSLSGSNGAQYDLKVGLGSGTPSDWFPL